jgi:hypothetical protein
MIKKQIRQNKAAKSVDKKYAERAGTLLPISFQQLLFHF